MLLEQSACKMDYELQRRGAVPLSGNTKKTLEALEKEICEVERTFNGDISIVEDFFKRFRRNEVCLSTMILANAADLQTCASCTAVSVSNDSLLNGTLQKFSEFAFSHGVGIGYDISKLSEIPKVINMINDVLKRINEPLKAAMRRPVAAMVTLRFSHREIIEFIDIASENKTPLITYSIWVTESDVAELVKPSYRVSNKKVPCMDGELFQRLCSSIMASGNPGLLFLNRFNDANSVPSYPIASAAPCGEVGLSNADACHIGYINLKSTLINGEINWHQIDNNARQLTRVLDDCVQITISSSTQLFEAVEKMRRIIIGVSGFADLLDGLGVGYYSGEAINIANRIGETIAFATIQESINLADERGCFPEFSNSRFLDESWKTWSERNESGTRDWKSIAKIVMERGIRNASTTAIPPGETAATYFSVTPSIEPIGFQYSTGKTLQNIENELKIMEAFQIWNDGAISKTVNIPRSSSIADIKAILQKAMDCKIRGITLYRNQHE